MFAPDRANLQDKSQKSRKCNTTDAKGTRLETDSFLTFDTPKATCYDSSRKAGIDQSVYPSARITRFGLQNAGDWSGP